MLPLLTFMQKIFKNLKKVITYSKLIFCNSGTEAVIKSLRLSRALSKKSKGSLCYRRLAWFNRSITI